MQKRFHLSPGNSIFPGWRHAARESRHLIFSGTGIFGFGRLGKSGFPRPGISFALILGALLGAFASGCSRTDRMSTFDPKGPIAEMQLDIFLVTLKVAAFLFITVGGALLFTLIRFREKPGDEKKPMPTQSHGNPLIEISLIGFSVLCLVLIAVPTVKGIWKMEVLPKAAPEKIVEINVTGSQWWWAFEYPKWNITTANELVIPKNTVVKLNLRSHDVIHSFWLPKIAGKVDLIPGRPNWMWIKSGEEGIYYGQCAEFCGEAHAYMLLRASVLSDQNWEKWLRTEGGDASPPAPAASWPEFFSNLDAPAESKIENPETAGARLFFTGKGGCVQCHTVNGAVDAAGNARASGRLGPDLTHVASRTSLGAGLLENRGESGAIDPERQLDNFITWVSASDSVKPGNLMYREVLKKDLSEADFQHLAAFLRSLK